jgi:hypothetical protein
LDKATLHAFIASLDTSDPEVVARISALNERVIAGAAKAHGISKISLDFAGGGDSGEFGEPTFLGIDGTLMEGVELAVFVVKTDREFSVETRECIWKVSLCEMALDEAVTEHVEHQVSLQGVNWYDNEGGQGDWCMDLVEGKVTLSIDVNVVESYTEHNETTPIGFLPGTRFAPVQGLDSSGTELPNH